MQRIWIMRKIDWAPDGTPRSVLVRADAISYLSLEKRQIRVAEVGSDSAVLADTTDCGHNAPELPDSFDADLLFAIAMARRDAACNADEDDRILMAQLEDEHWVWRMFRPTAQGSEPSSLLDLLDPTGPTTSERAGESLRGAGAWAAAGALSSSEPCEKRP